MYGQKDKKKKLKLITARSADKISVVLVWQPKP